jgi:hypothetical protein
MGVTVVQRNDPLHLFHTLYAHFACEVLPSQGIDVTVPAFDTIRLRTAKRFSLVENKDHALCVLSRKWAPRVDVSEAKKKEMKIITA